MKLGKRLMLGIGPVVGAAIIYALGATWRFEIRGYRHFLAAKRHRRPVIGAGFHGRLLAVAYRCGRPDWRPWRILVSGSRDGEFIARIDHLLQLDTARGSAGRGGARGFMDLVRSIRAEPGKAIGMLVDGGARGPRGVVKMGTVRLSKATGAWVVPCLISADRPLVFRKSWDRFMIPMPWNTVHMTFLRPILVLGRGDAAMERARQRLEDAMVAAQTRLDREAHYPDKAPVRVGKKG